MLVGNIFVWIGLAAACASAVCYALAVRRGKEWRGYARMCFALVGSSTLAASALLCYLLLAHQFQVQYVAEYSSSSLSVGYLISAFWAGQEGSFLLWVLLGVFLGMALIARAGSDEPYVMAVFSLHQAFLLLLLALKSPFALGTAVPEDGQGLNPLLRDPWMIAHPPMLFLGYAGMTVPFAYAVAALCRRNYDAWAVRSRSWILFAWTVLGAGIMMGGNWAYRVLGWGGYWAWDPVENASLVPWLAGTALLHGILLQRGRASARRSNLFLAILCYLVVLYGTFLTRSGILKDFSVHSFVEPGKAIYWVLLGGMGLATVVSLGLLALRWREIPGSRAADRLLSREFTSFLVMLLMSISTALVLVGNSAPILTGLLQQKASSVQAAFYNKTHFPLAVLLAVAMGIGPLLAWKGRNLRSLPRRLRLPVAGAFVAAAACVPLRPPDAEVGRFVLYLLLIAAGAFGTMANWPLFLRAARGRLGNSGGYLAHAGVGLLLAGVVTSGPLGRSDTISLRPGESAAPLGRKMTFAGIEELEKPDRMILNLDLQEGRRSVKATPNMLFSESSEDPMHRPYIRRLWLQDVYIAPVSLETPDPVGGFRTLEMAKGQTETLGEYKVTFRNFRMDGEMGKEGMRIAAIVDVARGDKRWTVEPAAQMAAGGMAARPATVPGTEMVLGLAGIQVPKAVLQVRGFEPTVPGAPPPRETATFQVSTKPGINLIWLGTLMILAGGTLATRRRARESARLGEPLKGRMGEWESGRAGERVKG